MLKVNDWIPQEAHTEFQDVLEKHGDKNILREVDGCVHPFPKSNNPHKYIFNWVILEDGGVLGWNESPRNGWNFTYVGSRAVDNFYEKHNVKDIREDGDEKEVKVLLEKIKPSFSHIEGGSIFYTAYTEKYKFVFEEFIEELCDLSVSKDDYLDYKDADNINVYNNNKQLVYSKTQG